MTFGQPKAWKGLVSMSAEPNGETAEFYADDILYYVASANNGYEVTLETALVPDWFLTEYLGMQTDSNDNIVETAEDTAKPFCMLFEFTGDAKAIKHAMYYCKATSRPNIEGETKGDSVEVKTEEISVTAMPLPTSSDRERSIIKSKTTSTTKNYSTWYTTVDVPTITGE